MKNNISFFLGLLFVSCVQNIIHPSVKKYFKPALKSSCTLEDKKIIFLKKEPLPLNFFPSKMSHFNGKMSHKYFKRYKRKGNEDHKEGASNTINKNFSVHYPGFISRVFAFEWKSTIPRFMMRNFSCLRERYIIYFYLAFDLLREECFRKYTLLNQLNQAFEKNRFLKVALCDPRKQLISEYFLPPNVDQKIFSLNFFERAFLERTGFLDINNFFNLLFKKSKFSLLKNISIENLLTLYFLFAKKKLSFDAYKSKQEIAVQLSFLIKNALMEREFKSMPYKLFSDVLSINVSSRKHIITGLTFLIKKLLNSSDYLKEKFLFKKSLDLKVIRKVISKMKKILLFCELRNKLHEKEKKIYATILNIKGILPKK